MSTSSQPTSNVSNNVVCDNVVDTASAFTTQSMSQVNASAPVDTYGSGQTIQWSNQIGYAAVAGTPAVATIATNVNLPAGVMDPNAIAYNYYDAYQQQAIQYANQYAQMWTYNQQMVATPTITHVDHTVANVGSKKATKVHSNHFNSIATGKSQAYHKLSGPKDEQVDGSSGGATAGDGDYEEDDDDDPTIDRGQKSGKTNNTLPIWGNEKTMNLNSLILTNILQSPYFKVNLFQLKTYHEVIDEIYYNVKHLEPWERGSRKTSGQTGMCGSVRGVGAGGIVSTPFCILYKLYTLRLTRKQLVGLLKHKDSPYIRALGFMYIRFTQPPNSFWKWYEPYLDDPEEVEVKSGVTITMGELVRQMLIKLDWYSTLFPRMPVPVQKDIEKKLKERDRGQNRTNTNNSDATKSALTCGPLEDGEVSNDNEEDIKPSSRSYGREKGYRDNREARDNRNNRINRSPDRNRYRSPSPGYSRDYKHRDHGRERDFKKDRRERDYDHKLSRTRKRSRSDSRERYSHRDYDCKRKVR